MSERLLANNDNNVMTTKIARQSTVVRKHQIIEAVINLITVKGMDHVTIDAIAEQVGLTEGAIYRHFASKHQILMLLVDDIEQNLIRKVADSQVEGESALKNLEHVLEAHLDDVEDRRATSFIIIAEAMSFDGIGLAHRVAQMLLNYLGVVQDVIRQGVSEGSMREDLDVSAAATAFLGLVQSAATLWALNDYSHSLTEQRVNMWGIYRRGVAA